MKEFFLKFINKYNIICYVVILVICVFAFQVRVKLAEMRLPYQQNYDEPLMTREALNMIKKNDYVMRGPGLGYSGFMTYICVAIDYVHFYFLKQSDPVISKTKSFKSVMTDQEGYYRNPSHPSFIYWNRMFVVVISTACFFVLFLLGKNFLNPWLGVLAAGMLLTSYYNFETSASVNVDVPGGFWVLLCMLFSFLYVDSLKIKYLYYSVAMAGMAISTKASLFLSLLVPLLAFIMNIHLFWDYFKKPHLFFRLVGMALIPVILYVLWNPALYLNNEEMLATLKSVYKTYRSPNTGHFSKEPGMEHFLFQVSEIRRTMPIFFELSLIGIVLSFIRLLQVENKWKLSLFYNKKSLLLLVFPIFYMTYMSQNYIAYHRNFFLIYYIVCLYASFTAIFLLDNLMNLLQIRIGALRNTIMAIGFGLVWHYHLSGLFESIKVLASPQSYLGKDTRTKTTDWLNEQPPHSVAFAKELRMSPVDLGNLKAKYVIFSQKNTDLDSMLNIYPLVVVGEYKSNMPNLALEDSLINMQHKHLNPVFSLKGSFMFRDTSDTYLLDLDPKIMIFSKKLDSISVKKSFTVLPTTNL